MSMAPPLLRVTVPGGPTTRTVFNPVSKRREPIDHDLPDEHFAICSHCKHWNMRYRHTQGVAKSWCKCDCHNVAPLAPAKVAELDPYNLEPTPVTYKPGMMTVLNRMETGTAVSGSMKWK